MNFRFNYQLVVFSLFKKTFGVFVQDAFVNTPKVNDLSYFYCLSIVCISRHNSFFLLIFSPF